jgi:hypothetical protein
MKTDDELFRTVVIAWVVVVTIMLGILLPYTVNVPALPALFYKTVTERSPGTGQLLRVSPGQSGANPEGLLLYYDFEDELAKTRMAFDRSGNNNNAIANGVLIGSAPGIIGNTSVSLPGTGYLYSEPDPVAGRTNVSFSLWFTVPDTTHNYRLASALSADPPRSGWIIGTRSSELWDDAGNPVRVSGGIWSVGSQPFTVWNHKILVYNGSSVTEYLNGFVTSEYSASGRPVGTGRAVVIGSWQPFGQNYAGRIDDFRIYDHALNATEIAALDLPGP